jgi:methyltransferase (TIGR00027 family)
MTEKSSLEEQASGTAMATAFMRALAVYDPRKEIRGNDYLAEIFLEERQKKPLKDPAMRAWVMKNKIAPGAYEFMIARTAFFDRIVEKALKENIDQVVLLGAGYDSRPYRFGKFIQNTKIFELDAKPTQQRKKEYLQRAEISISEQISFVPINFETDNLGEILTEAGFNQGKKTLFIWEGVTYYLTAEAVDNMLAFVRSNAPSGSSISFDYASLSDEALNEDGAKELRKHLQSQYSNEPTKFGIKAGRIEAFLAERGFEVIEHLTAAEMNEKFLSIDNDLKVGKVPSLFCLVYATVVGKSNDTKKYVA